MLRAGEQAIGVLVFRKTEHVEINLHQLRAVTAALGLTFAAWMARQTVRLHEEATAIVAHDLRSPVTSMLLQIEILRAAVELGKMPSSSTLDRLSKSGSRLARMTEDLMDSTRIELSRVRLDKLLLDPVECIQNLVEHILPTLGEREVLVRLLQRPSPTMLDPIRFDQILTNIIENAAKYSPAGTPIRLEVRAEAGGVEIKVHDTGMGILPDEIPRLFDRFYQAKRIRDGKKGLGLGLYITKGLIQAHGGTIAVASTPNRGTTVRIWLPGTAASEVHTTIAANPLAPASK
jgi:signal transduction histidine kinase